MPFHLSSRGETEQAIRQARTSTYGGGRTQVRFAGAGTYDAAASARQGRPVYRQAYNARASREQGRPIFGITPQERARLSGQGTLTTPTQRAGLYVPRRAPLATRTTGPGLYVPTSRQPEKKRTKTLFELGQRQRGGRGPYDPAEYGRQMSEYFSQFYRVTVGPDTEPGYAEGFGAGGGYDFGFGDGGGGGGGGGRVPRWAIDLVLWSPNQ